MKLYAQKLPLTDWLASLLGWRPARPVQSGAGKRNKPHPRRRHSAFLELP